MGGAKAYVEVVPNPKSCTFGRKVDRPLEEPSAKAPGLSGHRRCPPPGLGHTCSEFAVGVARSRSGAVPLRVRA